MLDWPTYVRSRLRLRGVDSARQNEIVEELAAFLEDCYREARSLGATDQEAAERARGQI